MWIRWTARLGVIATVALLAILLTVESVAHLNGRHWAAINLLREILSLGVVISFIPLLQKSKLIEKGALTNKLKGLYFGVAGLVLLSAASQLIWNRVGNGHLTFGRANTLLFESFPFAVFGLVMSILTAGLFLGILLVLRDLIYFKRKRSSARNFRLFLAFLVLCALNALLKRHGLHYNSFDLRLSDRLEEVILFVLIVLMVVNSLRNAWVNYLKKRQKLHCLWLSLPLIVGALLLQTRVVRLPPVEIYSSSLAPVVENLGLFLCVYLGMSFLSLLLHLPTAGIFDRKIREIESLHDLSRTLSSVFDSAKIASMITNKAAAIINSSAVWLQVKNPMTGELAVASHENLSAEQLTQIDKSSSNGLNGWIVDNKESILINEIAKDPRSNYLKAWNKSFESILGVPLVSQNRVLGVLYSAKSDAFAYDEEDRELLQVFANQASIALENARLFEKLVSKERFEQELKVAQDAQRKLLPDKMPQVTGLAIDAVSVTANEVGGDYYDFFELGDKLGIVVADVSGKGARAAFYMAQLKGIIESLASIYSSPRDLIVHINKSLCRNLERSSFISLIYAIIDLKKKDLVFTRAGHCPLLVCSSGNSAKFLEPKGLGLGLKYGSEFADSLEEKKLRLKTGDVLLFYTDGVVEARNSRHTEFEQERLRDLVLQNRHLSPSEIKATIVDEIQHFVGGSKYHDDLTFVVSKVN